MTKIAAKINDVVKLGLAALLKEQDYKKSGLNWHKEFNGDWLIVNVQPSSANRGTAGKIAVNLGVYNAAIAELSGKTPLVKAPKEGQAILRKRLGVLAYGHDHWWEIDDSEQFQTVSDDIVKHMNDAGIPWLNSHTEIEALSEALREQPSTASFSAALLAGDKQESLRRLDQAIKDRPRAQKHYTTWAKQVGLTPE